MGSFGGAGGLLIWSFRTECERSWGMAHGDKRKTFFNRILIREQQKKIRGGFSEAEVVEVGPAMYACVLVMLCHAMLCYECMLFFAIAAQVFE